MYMNLQAHDEADPPFYEGGIIQASPWPPGVKITQGEQSSTKKPET